MSGDMNPYIMMQLEKSTASVPANTSVRVGARVARPFIPGCPAVQLSLRRSGVVAPRGALM